MKKSSFKNVHDVKNFAHQAIKYVTPEMVQRCIKHTEEQEDYYRFLHKLKPLPVEEIDCEVDDGAKDSEENVKEDVVSFVQDGQISTSLQELPVEIIETAPEVLPSLY